MTKVAEEGSTPKSDRHKTEIYFHSPNIAVRILSSFIILKTLSRGEIPVDVLDDCQISSNSRIHHFSLAAKKNLATMQSTLSDWFISWGTSVIVFA